jgi:3-methyl-2-oxobutanoate hydroxymethyltransferase
MGGYRLQGKESASAQRLIEDAVPLEKAGAGMIVLEAVPALLAAEITAQLNIPTIGIGAGAECSGQVLVLHDMLDIYPGKKARFVKNYMQDAVSIADAVARYVSDVKSGIFPAKEHSF